MAGIALTFGGNLRKPPTLVLKENVPMPPARQERLELPDSAKFQPVPPKGAASVPSSPVDEDSDEVETAPERPQVAPPVVTPPPAPSVLPPLPPKQSQPVVPRRGIRPGTLAPVE